MKKMHVISLSLVIFMAISSYANAFPLNLLFKLAIDATVDGVESVSKNNLNNSTEPSWQVAFRETFAKEGLTITEFKDRIIFPNHVFCVLYGKEEDRAVVLVAYDTNGNGRTSSFDSRALAGIEEISAMPLDQRMVEYADNFKRTTGVNLLPSSSEEVWAEASRDFKSKKGIDLMIAGNTEGIKFSNGYSALAVSAVAGDQTYKVIAIQQDGKITGHFITVSIADYRDFTTNQQLLAQAFSKNCFNLNLAAATPSLASQPLASLQ